MATVDERVLPSRIREYRWAVDIVQRRFTKELERYCSDEFVHERYSKFIRERDPILHPLTRRSRNQKGPRRAPRTLRDSQLLM